MLLEVRSQEPGARIKSNYHAIFIWPSLLASDFWLLPFALYAKEI
jgi:hypothetical protein